MRPAVTGSQRYRRTDALGEDELGALWRGTDVRSGAPVTVRVLDERLTSDSQAAQRVAARLQRVQWNGSNPHLPRVLELRLTERPAVVVTEGSGRETLARHLERVGALSTRRALRVVAAVADGLAGAHEVWVSHGALTPASVLVDERAVAKVVDVGLGELLLDRDEHRRMAHSTNLIDRRAADVLAVGLLFERLISDPGARLAPSEADAPPALEDEVPAEVRALLRRAVSPHWLQRPGMAEIAATLAPALATTDEDEPGLARAARLAAPPGQDAASEGLPVEPGLPAPPRPDPSAVAAAEPISPRPAREVSEALDVPPSRVAVSRGRRRRRVVLVALVSSLVVIGTSVGAVLALRDTSEGRGRPASSGAASPSVAASVTPLVTPALQPATVPAVLGLRLESATELLQQVGLVVGSVTTEPGRAGVVVRTEPTQGEAVAAGTAVDLFVGNGAEG